VVAYVSRTLTKAERWYCVIPCEMLALVWAVRHFRPYLYWKPFTVHTDHNSLKWLQSFRDPEGQLARWLEVLAEYQFTVEHRAGSKHGNADSLSRSQVHSVWPPEAEGSCSHHLACIQHIMKLAVGHCYGHQRNYKLYNGLTLIFILPLNGLPAIACLLHFLIRTVTIYRHCGLSDSSW